MNWEYIARNILCDCRDLKKELILKYIDFLDYIGVINRLKIKPDETS